MILDCVVTATNDNPMYIGFVPIFIQTWKKLYPRVDVKIIVVADKIPQEIEEYSENIILYQPLRNISSVFISQYIRLLYPCILDYKNAILITDMDMMPMNRTYYTDNISPYDDNKFIYYRGNACFEMNQMAMCYNAACPKVWREIFNINTFEDIEKRLKEVTNLHWSIDQEHLFQRVMSWNLKTRGLICLSDKETGFHRLDRCSIDISNMDTIDKICDGKYTDYHCLRPMDKFRETNEFIYKLLK